MSGIGEKVLRLGLIEKAAFLITNEFLFCLLYFLRDLNRPTTSSTLARDLGGDHDLIIDHLQVLVSHGFLVSEAGKFRISEIGREVVRIAEEGIGNKPRIVANAASPGYSEIHIDFAEAGAGNHTLQFALNVSFDDVLSGTKIARTNRSKTASGSAATAPAEQVGTLHPSEDAETEPASVQP